MYKASVWSIVKNQNSSICCGDFYFVHCMIMVFFAGAVQNNLLTTAATDFEIEAVIKIWLKFAPERDGGRQKREQLKKI